MSEEIKKEGGENPETVTITKDDWEKVQTQLENLNKGIATYRDEAKTAKEVAQASQDALEAYKKEAGDSGKKPEDTSDLSPEDQKKFDAWAKKQGLVTKEDLQKERQTERTESAKEIADTATTEFLEKHPEYDDDEKWKEVVAEFNLYKTPKTLVEYRKLLEKVHKNLTGGEEADDNATAKAKADINRMSILTLSKGGGQGGNKQEFESAVDAMQQKYPSLSRDQIIARVREINELYDDKKD